METGEAATDHAASSAPLIGNPSPEIPIGSFSSMIQDLKMTSTLLNKRMNIARQFQRLADEIGRKRAGIGRKMDARLKELTKSVEMPITEDGSQQQLVEDPSAAERAGIIQEAQAEMDRLQGLHAQIMYDYQKIQEEIREIMLVRKTMFENIGVS